MSGRAVEAAGDTQTLLLDKTGTITLGNRMASDFYPVGGHSEQEVADAAQLASLADETPEGRSIVVLAKERFDIRARDLGGDHTFVPFTATTRMSGLDLGPRRIRKGAADSVKRWVTELGGSIPDDLDPAVERISRAGSTPLAVADGPRILGVIELKDVVKQGIRERFDEMRAMGIRTVMVTRQSSHRCRHRPRGRSRRLSRRGDARDEVGPHQVGTGGRQAHRHDRRRDERRAGARASGRRRGHELGTTAAKEAGNMVDLDSNPTKLLEIVEIGKQLLITRGALRPSLSRTTWRSTSPSSPLCSSRPTRSSRRSTS